MILADTSILVEMARKPTVVVTRIVLSRKPIICGIVVAELYTGVRTESERRDVEASLRLFRQVPMDEPIWRLTGAIVGAMTRHGTKVKFQDAAIAATAMHNDVPIWTRDRHFTWIQSAFAELVLFDENLA